MRKIASFLVLSLVFCLIVIPAQASVDPDTVWLTLSPGESASIPKTVIVPGVIPKGDILFAFDLTGSMSDEIDVAKAEAYNIMVAISGLVADPRFGVISYMDYPHWYDTCGYSDSYGSGPDYAYSLDQPLTSDTALVRTVIEGLTGGSGDDGAQDYERIFYESYADSANIGYRPGAKKVLLNFADCFPHDCNLSEGIEPGIFSTGGDPGRDEIMGNSDDLDLQTVLGEMTAHGVTLLEVHGSTNCGYLNYWQYWCSLTDGAFFLLSEAAQIPAAVESLILEQALYIDSLTLKVMTPGFESWLTMLDPPYYLDITAPDTLYFTEKITVPPETTGGNIHIFQISAIGDGASYGDQIVLVTVPSGLLVELDIKPQSCPNPFNIGSKGVLPVAILGTAEFDVMTVDPATVELEGVPPLRWSYEDVATPVGPDADTCECTTLGADGYMDMTLKFDHQATAAALGTVQNREVRPLTLTGTTYDSIPIMGKDCVVIIYKGIAKPSVEMALEFGLGTNYPNPFNPATSISFSLPNPSNWSLKIYNVVGQLVKSFEGYSSGEVSVTWDGKDSDGYEVASGIYFYRLNAGNFSATKKMVLSK